MKPKPPTNRLRPFWDAVATGQTPTVADLEHEGFPTNVHASVRRQIRDVHDLLARGEQAVAREHARACAADWERRLGDNLAPAEDPDPRTTVAAIPYF